eukprot:TRINITY_DN6996_c0_g3_i1.p2 TRINITY_DN6996_c0_g3~~TRINITY_DN6996_c0_g3_i1.p2  ORF type:complete len:206 (-),score=30.38 TRINITY_DN6996_c0_g3_i1:773-1390(-)
MIFTNPLNKSALAGETVWDGEELGVETRHGVNSVKVSKSPSTPFSLYKTKHRDVGHGPKLKGLKGSFLFALDAEEENELMINSKIPTRNNFKLLGAMRFRMRTVERMQSENNLIPLTERITHTTEEDKVSKLPFKHSHIIDLNVFTSDVVDRYSRTPTHNQHSSRSLVSKNLFAESFHECERAALRAKSHPYAMASSSLYASVNS